MPKDKVKTINEIEFTRLNLQMIDGQDCGGFYNYHDHLIIIVPFDNQPVLKLTKLSKEQIDHIDKQNNSMVNEKGVRVIQKEGREVQLCKYFNCSIETDKKKNGQFYSYCKKHRDMFNKNKQNGRDRKQSNQRRDKFASSIENELSDQKKKMCKACLNYPVEVDQDGLETDYCERCRKIVTPSENKSQTHEEIRNNCLLFDRVLCEDKRCILCDERG